MCVKEKRIERVGSVWEEGRERVYVCACVRESACAVLLDAGV